MTRLSSSFVRDRQLIIVEAKIVGPANAKKARLVLDTKAYGTVNTWIEADSATAQRPSSAQIGPNTRVESSAISNDHRNVPARSSNETVTGPGSVTRCH